MHVACELTNSGSALHRTAGLLHQAGMSQCSTLAALNAGSYPARLCASAAANPNIDINHAVVRFRGIRSQHISFGGLEARCDDVQVSSPKVSQPCGACLQVIVGYNRVEKYWIGELSR